MKFPSLVKNQFCKTPVEVTIYGEGLTEDGAPDVLFECRELFPSNDLYPSDTLHGGCVYCNLQNKAKTVMTAQKKIVQVNGILLVPGDIIPNSSTISSGFVVIDGVKRDIVQGIKVRNPDGTVNYTELDVM